VVEPTTGPVPLTLTVNGVAHTLAVAPTATLLGVLRDGWA